MSLQLFFNRRSENIVVILPGDFPWAITATTLSGIPGIISIISLLSPTVPTVNCGRGAGTHYPSSCETPGGARNPSPLQFAKVNYRESLRQREGDSGAPRRGDKKR